ncbi:MAG: type II toxin-antitoxin system HicB family antitoxin [Patescibacteria group bacterium]
MKIQSFQINLIKEPEGGYTVIVPQLPGCASFGQTIEEAEKNAKQAIELHLANLAAHNKNSVNKLIQKTVLSTVIQAKSYA